MKLLVQEELRPLVMNRSQPCISIYLPTLRGKESQQNVIRFRNLTGKARECLIARGIRGSEAQKYVEPLEAMMLDSGRWRNCSDGMAVFLSADMLQDYRLPRAFPETVVVSERFHLKPLLPLFARGGFFYLLALNLNGVRLFQCTPESISEVEITAKMPRSLEEAMKVYEFQEGLQMHVVAAGVRSRMLGFKQGHGGGGGADETVRKKYVLEYFRQVDRGIRQMLDQTQTPMLLAGVKYLCSLYREANSYHRLLDFELCGSTELMGTKDLHEQAWATYRPRFMQAQDAALGRYREMAGTAMSSSDLERIVPAAYRGQVSMLLAPEGLERWGKFDPTTEKIEVHPQQKDGEEDLVDLAAIHTLMHGGEVYMLGRDKPSSSLAAIFRYA